MTITIHRGTHEIGGSCVEIRTRQAKILLDLGLPLDFDARSQEQQKQIRREALEWAQDADAIFISHYHADHHGLLPDTHRDVAIYATAGTAAMMHVTEVIHGRGDADYLRHISVLFKDADDRKFEPVIVGDICITPYTVDLLNFLKYLEEHPLDHRPTLSVLINCGFLEYQQNEIAIRMLRLFSERNGYPFGSVLMIGSGEAILDSPFRPLVRRQIRRLARSIERRRYRTLHTTMPLPRKVFLVASTQYWLRYGQRFGTSRRQMETMQIEA